ncbi:hypothetical protein EV421DRAFT_1741317 [Armillaria borealis]|uniref:Heterokaryon incompatibility domain-containing protein n=1 Tax=Armillaria borealis TaxID=47425 RepID=A0AA39J1U8_9AGAR|nr:hypothetical protein EV421DRAFT_1741317 [Armillaria borealis]
MSGLWTRLFLIGTWRRVGQDRPDTAPPAFASLHQNNSLHMPLVTSKLTMDGKEWTHHYENVIYSSTPGLEPDEEAHRRYESLPEVTVSTFNTEARQAESYFSVPKQYRYTGRKPVIPSSLSNTPCKVFGVDGLLEMFNSILGTSYTLYRPRIHSLLEVFITKGLDFGIAYAHLRPLWYYNLDIEEELSTREEQDSKMQEGVLVNNRILDQRVPSRHVWDLHEWPVPTPKDTNLDLIRIEMLNVGAEYAWLDVLCLRQVGGWWEDLHAEEWKVDVPTTGRVYRGQEPILYYFNELGWPLHMKMGDFESDRSWFKCVWTLQEVSHWRIISRDMGDANTMAEEVAGMVYLLGWVDTIPAYYEMQSIEDAWTALVDVLWILEWGNLFFTYPKSGNGRKVWRPSWSQVMDTADVLPSKPRTVAGVEHEEKADADWIEALCIESGYVQRLAEGSHNSEETPCAQARNATVLKTLITPTPNTTHTNPQSSWGGYYAIEAD